MKTDDKLVNMFFNGCTVIITAVAVTTITMAFIQVIKDNSDKNRDDANKWRNQEESKKTQEKLGLRL
jgi:uncharacterized protein (DUF697 family)